MPAPVKNLQMKNIHGSTAKAVANVATQYTTRVSMNSFLRPHLSVSRPKNSAPRQAPKM